MSTSMVKYFIAAVVLVTLFQNCSATHESSSTLSSFQACNLILKDEFVKGYQKFLQTNCNSCHVSNGSGNGAFADSSVDTAFDAFIFRGYELVGARALDPNHQPPFTGSQHQSALSELEGTWSSAQAQVDVCVANSGGGIGGGIDDGLVPEDPTPTQGNITTFIKALEADKDEKTLSWNLENEIADPSDLSFPGATLEIDVRAITSSTGDKSYVISNPRLTAGSEALHITFIEFSINNKVVTNATSYHTVNRRVPAGETRDLGVGGTIFSYNIRATDVLALKIGRLETIEFDPPTFDELIAPTGVLGANCLSCHDGSNGNSTPQGGFDISSRDAIISQLMVSPYSPNNSEIYKRMNDLQRPMPQGGLLPVDQVDQVLWWIQDGAR